MGLLTTTLACLAMFPGCGGPPAVEAPPSVATFAISYERSGGLKPMPRKLTIRPGRVGQVTASRDVVGESDGAGTLFKVPAKTIKGLRRALARAGFAALPDPGTDPGTCADCYSYEIRYRNHDVSFNEVTMPRSLEPVLDRLEGIVDAHLPFH
jgi:hypothetical protein